MFLLILVKSYTLRFLLGKCKNKKMGDKLTQYQKSLIGSIDNFTKRVEDEELRSYVFF